MTNDHINFLVSMMRSSPLTLPYSLLTSSLSLVSIPTRLTAARYPWVRDKVDIQSIKLVPGYLETGDGGLEYRHGEAEGGEDGEHVERARGEVAEVKHGVEQLVAGTHGEEDAPVRVVELHPVVAGRVDELVAGRTLGLSH